MRGNQVGGTKPVGGYCASPLTAWRFAANRLSGGRDLTCRRGWQYWIVCHNNNRYKPNRIDNIIAGSQCDACWVVERVAEKARICQYLVWFACCIEGVTYVFLRKNHIDENPTLLAPIQVP